MCSTRARQEQYLYCDSAHPHQLSNLSQTASTPTCASKGTVDYTGSYDSWGNTTSQVRGGITRTLNYDGLDHLVRWSSSVNSQQEWNLYDASGERVLRRTYDGTNTVLTVFAFGVEEHAYSYSGSGSSDTNTSNTYYYTLGGHTLGTWDGTSPGSPTTNFLLTDTLGSVVSSFNNLPNGAAVVLGDQVYGPYGNRRVQQGTISTSKGFTGQFTDFVAGLDYYNARYYDPVVGVFVSADKVQGNLQGMNPYGYVGENPETSTDPTGQFIYDPETGQAARIVNGKVQIWQYNSGIESSPPPDPVYQPSILYTMSPLPKPTRPSHASKSKVAPVVAATSALAPGLQKLAQKLVRGNERLKTDFGSDQWTLLSAERGTDIINDPGAYTDRWYLTFDDGGGSKVVMSLNLNPKAGSSDDPWDMKRIHFSSNQLDPEKWGEKDGWARSTWGLDPGASENPGDETDMSFIAKMLGVSEEDPGIVGEGE